MGSEGQQDMEMAILTALLKGELSGGWRPRPSGASRVPGALGGLATPFLRGLADAGSSQGAGDPIPLGPRRCWELGPLELGSCGAVTSLGGFGGGSSRGFPWPAMADVRTGFHV